MKAVWVILLLVVIVGGILWFTTRDKEEGQKTTQTEVEENIATTDETEENVDEPQSVVITYTDSGFTPSNVVINVGDSVVFKNESSRSFQPASDPHPVHTDLSGFDANTSVPPGQSYTFTFSKSGSWGFHNHLDSDKTGTVIVR